MINTSFIPEYNIKILDMERDSLTGFVSRVIWNINAKYVGISTENDIEGDNSKIIYEEFIDQLVFRREFDDNGNTTPLPDDFIPFENLSYDVVVQWISNYIGEDRINSIKKTLREKILAKLQPKSLSGVPW